MSVELSISGALPFKRHPKVNIRIISLALHMVITIGILSTYTLNLDCYPSRNLLDNTHTFPMDTILNNTLGENYLDIRALADFVSVCLHRCQQVFWHRCWEMVDVISSN
jgi:hypothetical protein